MVFSVASQEDVDNITKIMEEAVLLCIPNKVDAELGDNWGDSMESSDNNL